MAVLNEAGYIVDANATWRELAERPGRNGVIGPIGANYVDLCEGIVNMGPRTIQIARGLSRMLTGQQIALDCTCSLIKGNWRHEFHIRIKRLGYCQPLRLLVIHRDVTKLAVAQRKARELNERLVDVQMNERQRLATELHDTVGQSMVSLTLNLSRLQMIVGQTEEISGVMSDMSAALQEVHAQIRTFSYLTRPPWPEEVGGLERATSQLVEGFARRAGLAAKVRMRGPPCNIDPSRELALFRILQEALVNIYRHARASSVDVELTNCGDQVTLRVMDDGCGFPDTGGTPAKPGVGILGMRARLKQFGGHLVIDSGATGTTLVASLRTHRAHRSVALTPA